MLKSTPTLGPIAVAVLSVVLLSFWQWQSHGKTATTPAMAGAWEGTARIVVSWCQQKELTVSLNIASDNTVTGKVGDATLKNARLKSNRGRLGRLLHVKTDYIIVGKLDGPIVATEKITRTGVKMPVNFDGKQFTGGLHTSGGKTGGKKRMKLSASSLTLTRTDN